MNRHPFRWEGLAFGALFLAIAGGWAVWEQDLLTRRELSLSSSAVLIVFGVLGVVATFWKPGAPGAPATTPADTGTESEEDTHEALDPQS